MFEKGQRFETSYNHETYAYAGKWSGSMVLAPENDGNTEVLIYTENEVHECLATRALWLLADLGLLVFFFFYAFVFQWAFDLAFGVPVSASSLESRDG